MKQKKGVLQPRSQGTGRREALGTSLGFLFRLALFISVQCSKQVMFSAFVFFLRRKSHLMTMTMSTLSPSTWIQPNRRSQMTCADPGLRPSRTPLFVSGVVTMACLDHFSILQKSEILLVVVVLRESNAETILFKGHNLQVLCHILKC